MKEDKTTGLKSAIESILFIHGEPVAISRLAKISGAAKKEIEKALEELRHEYRERGIVLLEKDGQWQFITNPQNKAVVDKVMSSDIPEELTRSALEVLAIVAYKEPVSRAVIEYIRGVNSSFILRNLLIRGLVAREENPKDRRAYLYKISADFMRHLGLAKMKDLPRYGEFRKKDMEIPAEAAAAEASTASAAS